MYPNIGQLNSSTLLAKARFPGDNCGMGALRNREGCHPLTPRVCPSVTLQAQDIISRWVKVSGPGLVFLLCHLVF